MSRANTWTNSDGLVVGFGTHSEDNEVAAVYQGSNGIVTVTQEIDMASLVAFGSESRTAYPNASGQEHVIPRGSVILGGEILVLVACTGTSADADFGTWVAVVDDSNLAVAGAISNSDVVITASYTTAYTAGRVRLTVNYRPPTGSAGDSLAV